MPSHVLLLPCASSSHSLSALINAFPLWAFNHHSLPPPPSAGRPGGLNTGGGQPELDHARLPVRGEVEGLTPVPLGSSQVGSRRGSPLPCWSSRNCTGSWKTSTRSRRGRHWRTGRRRTQRGRRTCSSPGCCSRKQSHRHLDWSTHSHL